MSRPKDVEAQAVDGERQSGAPSSISTSSTLTYQSVSISGVNVFYREAGRTDAPVLLLLHGYPSSSRIFDTLLPLLADRYRLIAPDYPGFGHSDAPSPETFSYTFNNIAALIEKFTDALELKSYAIYTQDYGGPIGFRLALAHPERIRAIIVQNAVASEEGLGSAWEIRKSYWKDRATYEDKVIGAFMSSEGAKTRHLGGSPRPERYNPDTWLGEFAQLSRPGQWKILSGSVLELSDQCRFLSELAGLLAALSAAAPGSLGEIRSVLRHRRCVRLSRMRARRRGPHSRCRALCAG